LRSKTIHGEGVRQCGRAVGQYFCVVFGHVVPSPEIGLASALQRGGELERYGNH
jgi:hypothetical protein